MTAASAAEGSIRTLEWVVHPHNGNAMGLMRSLRVDVRWDGDAFIGVQTLRRRVEPRTAAA